MALPVLDGNQTATTLSSVVTGGEHIVAHTVVSLGSAAISNITNAVSGSVVSISNFPATQTIAGTVTANVVGTRTFVDENAATVSGFLTVGGWDSVNFQHAPIPLNDGASGVKVSFDESRGAPIQVINRLNVPFLATVTIGNSVTANLAPQAKGPIIEIDSPIPADPKYMAIVGGNDINAGETRALQLGSNGGVIVEQLPAISGTVTVGAMPSGSLTTRFGTVTTANTAQITSAVTNTSRKYLLAQNISAGTVTIGIGFSPTTTQGIQLTAGGGLTFDAFCPT